MIHHIVKIAWRSLFREKKIALLNLAGLALGFAGFLLSYQFINRETSYDRWNTGYNEIYRIGLTYQGKFTDQTPPSLGQTVKERIPGVVEAGLVIPIPYGTFPLVNDENPEKSVLVRKGGLINQGAAEIFEVRKTTGRPFSEDNQELGLITKPMADALFTPEQKRSGTAIGTWAYHQGSGLYERIYGVWDNSRPGYLDFDFLQIKHITSETTGNPYTYQTFIKVEKGTDIPALTERINEIYQNETSRHAQVQSSTFARGAVFLDPLSHLHLRPKTGSNAPYLTVWVLGVLSVLILVLAATNFTNLILAQADSRAKEIGVKKVSGASRAALVFQYTVEVCLQCLIAALIAWGLLILAGNGLSKWFNDDIRSHLFTDKIFGQLLLMVGFTTLLSGLYPALHLTGFRPALLLRGRMQNQPQRRWVRNSLITFQFFIAIAFIAGAIVIHRQLAFMENTEKGFDPEQVIHFHGLGFYTSPHNDSFHHIRERMAFEPAVLSITATNQPPGGPAPPPAHQFAQGTWDAELDHVGVEAGYFETLGIRMRAGTTFSRTHRLDTSRHYAILNERAVQALDLQDAVGSTVRGCGVEFTIIGIAADSKTYGFERPVNPTVYSIGGECGDGRYHTSVLVRARRGQYQEAADALKKIWREHLPHIDDSFFHYTFLNAEYAALHARQTHLRTVFTGFTVLTILIAGIGLFAMSAYSVSTRQKEISIRKVLGADTWQLFLLLGKPFLLILGIACLLAIPLAAFISDRWLGNFAYRIDLSPMIFVYSCLALLGMVLAIIGYQAGKTSLEPPGRTLRDE